ncbi:hypothetical protein PIROE2DRAFT_59678 [Piromyces sp. E2]|nr:hypothetical protein PIROE2DRAFT_59678 [Piromyces sp. E2]|eukprot:OUM65957.1 hypothetical protein PIROE2DRAFT_59678 [Piromyces sp. E2]
MKKNYVIENGSVRFTVENEFEVTLKLEGKQQDNWRLLDLKIFVKPDDDLNHESIMPLQEYQLNNLKINAQNLIRTDIVPPENTNPTTAVAPTVNAVNTPASSLAEETKPSTPKKIWPLIELYRYLHSFCLSMHLEIFSLQIDYLIKTRWTNQLRLKISPDKKTLQIYYWIENGLNKINDSKSKDEKKANILELSISTAEDKIVFYTNKEHNEDETNSSLIAKSLIYEYEKYIQSNLNIKCYQLLEDEFALNSSLDNSNSTGISIIFGIKGEKTQVFYEEEKFLVEDFLKDYNVIQFLLKLKTKFKLFKNINAIKKFREQFKDYSLLNIEKKSLENIKMVYNNKYIIEIGQIADNLVGILYSDNSISDIRSLTPKTTPTIIIPQFSCFIDFVSQLIITGKVDKKIQNKDSAIKLEEGQEKKDEIRDSICLKIPNGIIFDIQYIDEVMEGLNKIMNSVSYMDWLYSAIPQIEVIPLNYLSTTISK